MNKIIAVFFLFTVGNLFGQISGISASKLSNFCTDPVPHYMLEFEPSLNVCFSKGFYNSQPEFNYYLPDGDSLSVSSDLFFRFTYGAADNLEIGFTVPASMGNVGIGAKYKVPFSFDNNTSFGVLAGLNFPLGTRGYRLSGNNSGGKLFSYGIAGGVIISYFFTKDFSVDINGIAQKNFPSNDAADYNTSSVFAGADFGYYFIKHVQAIIGFNYSEYNFNVSDSEQYGLVLNPGFTIETGKDFIIVLNTPITIAGKNIDKTFGFGFALTTALH